VSTALAETQVIVPVAVPPRPPETHGPRWFDLSVDRLRRRWVLLVVTALAAVAEIVPDIPALVSAAAGLWLLLGAPVVLWYAMCRSLVSSRDGRAVVALGCAVLSDILLALLLNTMSPWAGMHHPLSRVPLACVSILGIVMLAGMAPAFPSRLRFKNVPGLGVVSGLGAVVLLLSIAGPIRLNNGLGPSGAVSALLTSAVLMTVLFRGRRRHAPEVTALGIFVVALGLLLLSSLRGWYITGHDIQREYGVFQLTYIGQHWSIAAFRNPYNACLSINLWPAVVSQLTGISGVYVFKVVFPVLFAAAPVALYRAVRNLAPQSIALLSAFYFVLFPTYFTDMAFLARQEIAFLLLGCVMVLLTDREQPLGRRRTLVTVLLVGIVLTHYSTTYVVLASLAFAYLLARLLGLPARGRHRKNRRPDPLFVTWWMVLATAVAAMLWTGPLTHTGQQAHDTARAAVLEMLGRKDESASSDTAYSLLGGARVTAAQRLGDYAADTTRDTGKERAQGDYLSLKVISRHPIQAVEQPNMPLTSAGRLLEKAGINVTGLNTMVRLSAARLLQLLLIIGMIVVTFTRRPPFRATTELTALSLASVCVMGILTVLPELSVDYGLLRAFQQGLFFFAPFIAAASVWVFRWSRGRAQVFAYALCILLFLDLVGVIPKALGGYPAQLHLANSGQYYDIYYVHAEERSGIEWLQARASEEERESVQSEIQTDRYTFGRMQSLLQGRATNDIYPTLIGVNTYVFLGYTTVTKGEATVFYRGDLVTYRYPVGLLDQTKNKIYSSEGAEVYR
jgi:uncharacterized membrane protein